jgi:hypothetical protein
MTGTILVAVVGLAGIIGTFLAPTWTQRRTEDRQSERDFRTAQRLVTHELESIGWKFEHVAEDGAVPPLEAFEYQLATPLWPRENAALARLLADDEVWERLAHTYVLIDLALGGLRDDSNEAAESAGDAELSDYARMAVGKASELAREARALLANAQPK